MVQGRRRSAIGVGDADSTEDCVRSMLDSIDQKLLETFLGLQHSNLRQVLSREGVDLAMVKYAGREWSRGISFYHCYFTEASRSAYTNMPRTVDGKVLRCLRRLEAEIEDQGAAALRDYRALGGDVDVAGTQQPNPASYAVAAVWALIGNEDEPFSFLGALYAGDLASRWVSELLFDQILPRDLVEEGFELPQFWSTNGLRRSLVVRALIQMVAMKYPVSWELIVQGAERLIQVHPIPVCEEICRRVVTLSGDS